jgi:4-hydroxybenzoate polyprenyltransferase
MMREMASTVQRHEDPVLGGTGFWGMVAGVVRSLRLRQAAKNGLVLVPLFFTVNKWWEPGDTGGMAALAGKSLAAFLLFTLLSGAVYIINDIIDAERDRAHPVKRNRPIASGQLGVPAAWVTASVCGAGAVGLSFWLSIPFGYAAAGYGALNLAYSLLLKHLVIVDVMAIAAGFVIRAVAGSLVIEGSTIVVDGNPASLDLTISPWLYVVTGLGALFLALAKRRSELVNAGERSPEQRSTLSEYSVGLIDQMIAIVAPATLLAYTLYTFSSSSFGEPNIPDNGSMLLTVPFVAYGLFRYLYLLHRHNRGEAPEDVLLTDRPLLINIALWLLTAAGVLLADQ